MTRKGDRDIGFGAGEYKRLKQASCHFAPRQGRPLKHRLGTAGKPQMLILGAMIQKLLCVAYGVLRSGRPFDPSLLRWPDNSIYAGSATCGCAASGWPPWDRSVRHLENGRPTA
jgi:hypothetical protein